MDPTVLAAYLVTITLVLLPPDGNAILVAGAYAARGWRGAVAFAAGDLTANLAQMALGATAMAAVAAAVPDALGRLRWAGAGALIVLACYELARHRTTGHGSPAAAPPAGALWLRGFLVSAVNPIAVLFFAALLPTFLDPAQPLARQLLTLAAGWVIVDGTLLLAYGGLGGRLLTRLARSRPRVLGYANALGLVFAAGVVALIAPSA